MDGDFVWHPDEPGGSKGRYLLIVPIAVLGLFVAARAGAWGLPVFFLIFLVGVAVVEGLAQWLTARNRTRAEREHDEALMVLLNHDDAGRPLPPPDHDWKWV